MFEMTDQEGLPDYWGIETDRAQIYIPILWKKSGRITRLLGY